MTGGAILILVHSAGRPAPQRPLSDTPKFSGYSYGCWLLLAAGCWLLLLLLESSFCCIQTGSGLLVRSTADSAAYLLSTYSSGLARQT
jgi:hypothetical protein